MRVDFERSGGLDGRTHKASIDSEALPPDEALHLRLMVNPASFFDLPSLVSHVTPDGERFHFRITVHHSIDTDDGAAPAAMLPLIEWLTTKADPDFTEDDGARINPSLSLSDAGALFIRRFEGFQGKLYNDPGGHCTIGCGHLVHRGKCDGRPSEEEFRAGISEERALALLRADAGKAAGAVNDTVCVGVNQQQFDALVSFTFNVGITAFRTSTLCKKLNSGRYEEVPAQLNRWIYSSGKVKPGLVRRRKAEGALFRESIY